MSEYRFTYQDPNHEGNSKRYHYGRKCITKGCNNPAGTLWSPLWCFHCNVKRMDEINKAMDRVAAAVGEPEDPRDVHDD